MATDPTFSTARSEQAAAIPGSARAFRRSRFSRAVSGLIGASCGFLAMVAILVFDSSAADRESASEFEFRQGERLVLIGSTLADRLQHFGWLETRLQLAHPGLGLSIRNMGWSGDEVGLMPRPLDFGTLEAHLAHQKADTILMCFGTNESFAGEAGLPKFREDLVALVDRLRAEKFNGETSPRLVLVSPIAHEQLGGHWPDAAPRNVELERYTEAMREVAGEKKLAFIDLFHPTRSLMAENSDAPLTINGIHLTDEGYRVASEILALGLGVSDPLPEDVDAITALRDLIIEKNRQFMLRWRPVNAEYVFGRRKEPFGVLSFPPEMEQLDRQITELDEKIRAEAGKIAAARP